MKKQTFSGKLNFNKETVSKLEDNQMTSIQGGASAVSCPCDSYYCEEV